MSLSCDCSDWCPEPGDWFFWPPNDYKEAPAGRRKRCRSCGVQIEPGSLCLEFKRRRVPEHDVETRIYGEDGEIPIASWWHCEECADLYFSLTELGFCFPIDDDMHDLAAEYASDYGVEAVK